MVSLISDFFFNEVIYRNTNSNVADGIYNMLHGRFMSWIFTNNNSHYRPIQFITALNNFARFSESFVISSTDIFVSSLLHPIFPAWSFFSSRNSKDRRYKRIMVTLKRNGGIYNDMFDFIANFSPFSSSSYLLNKKPLNEPTNTSNFLFFYTRKNDMTNIQMRNVIERELKINIKDHFKEIGEEITRGDDFVRKFKAKLINGKNVTLSFVQPNVQRMRDYDLAPFKFVRFISNVVPFIDPEKAFFDSFLQRIDFNLGKEAKAREKILYIYGIDSKNTNLINDRKISSIPVHIPRPVSGLCSKHVMVTDYASRLQKVDNSPNTVRDIISFTTKMLKSGYVLPNLSKGNIIQHEGRTSLDKFASLTPIDAKTLANTGMVLESRDVRNFFSRKDTGSYTRDTRYRHYRDLVNSSNARSIMGFSEAFSCIATHSKQDPSIAIERVRRTFCNILQKA